MYPFYFSLSQTFISFCRDSCVRGLSGARVVRQGRETGPKTTDERRRWRRGGDRDDDGGEGQAPVENRNCPKNLYKEKK